MFVINNETYRQLYISLKIFEQFIEYYNKQLPLKKNSHKITSSKNGRSAITNSRSARINDRITITNARNAITNSRSARINDRIAITNARNARSTNWNPRINDWSARTNNRYVIPNNRYVIPNNIHVIPNDRSPRINDRNPRTSIKERTGLRAKMLGKTSRYSNIVKKIKEENAKIFQETQEKKTLSKKFKNTFRKGVGASYNVGRAVVGIPVHSLAYGIGKVLNITSKISVSPIIAVNIIKKYLYTNSQKIINKDIIENGLKIFFMALFIIIPGISIKFAVGIFTKFLNIFTKYKIDSDIFFNEILETINDAINIKKLKRSENGLLSSKYLKITKVNKKN
jgi:hypothetical protein